MSPIARTAPLVALLAACGFPKPADVGDVPADAEPGVALHVAPTGDDANDGLVLPVKTLKHAIGLAAANAKITSIVLASGRYATAGGETFPYSVPASLTIVGPAGGGAILAGSMTEQGMVVDGGALKDLELEDFTTAISAIGPATLTGLQVRTNMVALHAEATAPLNIDNLDISGSVATCATGIVLTGSTSLVAATLVTRNLGTTLDARDQSSIDVSKASIVGDRGCTQAVMPITSSGTFTISDSTLDGGHDGISLSPKAGALQATIRDSVLRNFKRDAVIGGSSNGSSVSLQMTGTGLLNNGQGGAELFAGTWSLTNVTAKQNAAFGIYLEDGDLVMRGCTVTENDNGVSLLFPSRVDLGTIDNLGNNILQNNTYVGLYYDSSRIQVDAIGNTWNPSVQGADIFGRYSTVAILQGPIPPALHNNYLMNCDPGQCTLRR